MSRFRKGTNDQDGNGEKGGSITQAEANRRATGDTDMAKTPSKPAEAPQKPVEAKKEPTTDERLDALERALKRQDKRLDQLEDVNGLRLASRGYKTA